MNQAMKKKIYMTKQQKQQQIARSRKKTNVHEQKTKAKGIRQKKVRDIEEFFVFSSAIECDDYDLCS